MVVYQKHGVICTTIVFAILQKLKFQIFRIFIFIEPCRNSSECLNSTLQNVSSATFFDQTYSHFLFKSLLIDNFLAILPCVFLSAWSDRHGRKSLLTLPYIGTFASDIFMLSVLYTSADTMTMLLVSESIYGICGGTVLMTIGCMCYVTDTTDHRSRTWYLSLVIGLLNVLPVVEMVFQYFFTPWNIGLDFRTLILSGVVARVAIAAVFLLYLKMCVLESVFVLGTYEGNPWMNLLTPINVSDTVNCVFKRRLDNMRFYIISLSTIFIFYNLTLTGNIIIYPQHFKNVFEYAYKNLVVFSSVFTFCQTTTLWIFTYSAMKWCILDIDLGIYGSFSLALSCFTLTFIKDAWLAVTGALCGIASLLVPTSVISVLSKLVERTETGSMYAGIGFLLLITQVIAVPSYNALNQISLEAGVPHVIFLLSLGLVSFGMMFFIYLKRNISPDILGHLRSTERLTVINRRGRIEQLFE